MAKIRPSINTHKIDKPEDFRAAMEAKGFKVPCSSSLDALCRPFDLYGRHIPNSMSMHPMEGLDAEFDGSPSQMTFMRYRNYAAQGVGVLWMEAVSYSKEGRDSRRQLWINEFNADRFRALAEEIDRVSMARHGYKPYKVIQLTHSGRCSVDAHDDPAPVTAFACPQLDKAMGMARIVSDEYIDRMQIQLAHAAKLAKDAGFDAVDIKLCHQYLQRELLCAYTRPGKYGGSMENRFRFTMESIDKIRAATSAGSTAVEGCCGGNAASATGYAGSTGAPLSGTACGSTEMPLNSTSCGSTVPTASGSIDIVVRLNVYDALPYPYGWGMVKQNMVMKDDPSEVIELIRQLSDKGVKLFDLSTTSPRFGPYGNGYMDNFDDEALVDPIKGASYLMNAIRNIKSQIPEGVKLIATGLGWFGPFGAHVGAGGIDEGWFDIAGFGRNIIADPDFVPTILREGKVNRKSICVGCDRCFEMFATKFPTGCPTRNVMYKTLYKLLKNEGIIKGTAVY